MKTIIYHTEAKYNRRTGSSLVKAQVYEIKKIGRFISEKWYGIPEVLKVKLAL